MIQNPDFCVLLIHVAIVADTRHGKCSCSHSGLKGTAVDQTPPRVKTAVVL